MLHSPAGRIIQAADVLPAAATSEVVLLVLNPAREFDRVSLCTDKAGGLSYASTSQTQNLLFD